jgi:prophage tail gpP-like protein
MAFPQNEVAEIHVGGMIYRDWQNFLVRIEAASGLREFQFTTAELDPPPNNPAGWWVYRIRPGDYVEIYLAGQLVLTGYVNVRVASYDSHSHQVQIMGRSVHQDSHDSSAVHDTGEFKNQTWEQIARTVLGKRGIGLEMKGDTGPPFEKAEIHWGETDIHFLDRLARKAGIVMVAGAGKTMLAYNIKDNPAGSGVALIEGQNILRGVCTIRDDYAFDKIIGIGQNFSSDEHWGPQVAQMKNMLAGLGGRENRSRILVIEDVANMADLKTRTSTEAAWLGSTIIECEIDVFGWLRNNGISGSLWEVWENVHVTSPMLMLDQDLTVKTVTFHQDVENGTQTTLELVRPGSIGGQIQATGN